MTLVWYDAKADELFLDGMLDACFYALSICPDFFDEYPHIELIGAL